jgi:hypothetical protein
MDRSKLGSALTHLGNLAVLAGIVLVAIEINQNSVLVEAQLESELYAAWVDIDASKQSEAFAEVLAKAIEQPEQLTLAEMVELDGYLYSYFDLLWRREQLHSFGIGDDLETEIRGNIRDYFGNPFAHAWWEETKFKYGPEFVATFERVLSEISPEQDAQFFGRIEERLADGRGAPP